MYDYFPRYFSALRFCFSSLPVSSHKLDLFQQKRPKMPVSVQNMGRYRHHIVFHIEKKR